MGEVAVHRERRNHRRGLHAFAAHHEHREQEDRPPAGGTLPLRRRTQLAIDMLLHVLAHAQHVHGAADDRSRRDPRHQAFPGRRHRTDARQQHPEQRRQHQRGDDTRADRTDQRRSSRTPKVKGRDGDDEQGFQSFTERDQQRLQHSVLRGLRASAAVHSK
jgi:hypothetical protein